MSKNDTVAVPKKVLQDIIDVLDVVLAVAKGEKTE